MSTIMILIPFIVASLFPHFQVSQPLTSSLFAKQGQWNLMRPNIGISAMHMQLLRNDKIIIFDRTDFGHSSIPLSNGRCRIDPYDIALKIDCSAHSVLYDVATNTLRPLMIQTDTWCSSASVLPNGTLIQTGGYNDGERSIRMFTPCYDETCDWVEFPRMLSQRRWYATNQILPDSRVIVVGGRRQFNYEFLPKNPNPNNDYPSAIPFSFLQQTSDASENNLYPFVHLLPDGNLFIFANTKSVLLDYKQNRVIKQFPPIPGEEPRNYPSSGSSVLLPLDENLGSPEAEVVVCGGAPRGAFDSATRGNFMKTLATCGRLKLTNPSPTWVMEYMPMPRAMGDMVLLPNGEVVIINGVAAGTAGWENGREPVLTPVIFRPSETDSGEKFSVMAPASRPRLYHSCAVLVKDGRVLAGGSNPHVYYNFTGVEYPTDLSLEAFSPPYLAPEFDPVRPTIRYITNNNVLGYRVFCYVTFTVPYYGSASDVSVRIIAPSFSTHSFGQNQRMVVLKLSGVTYLAGEAYYATVVGPSTAEIAPPGYYMLFVVHKGVPSSGSWVQVM
ncbi:aldehyde oxidase GLOX [Cajanus cajan]|uniref:Galactose oxidase n=1 Tax=Cajanus cajan TaxID=3821 RepID=A0A151TXM6_CAJCA|nr:aldehyde oxidase GLOX [Cajanus cajan]KYP71768.1 Galactose oxidase [Cajanus cajan]